MKSPTPFSDDARELSNRLFVEATSILEDALGNAIAGQSPRLTPSACRTQARKLRAAAKALATLADAALVVSNGDPDKPRKQPRSRHR